jgi:hypothetical protein
MNYDPKKPTRNENPNTTSIGRSKTAPTNLALNFFDLIARDTCLTTHFANQIQRAMTPMRTGITTISQPDITTPYTVFSGCGFVTKSGVELVACLLRLILGWFYFRAFHSKGNEFPFPKVIVERSPCI